MKATDVNPDVGGLLVDDVRLCVGGNGLQTLLPLSRVICDGDEKGRRQQDQLEFPLTAVQKHCPATEGGGSHKLLLRHHDWSREWRRLKRD